MFVLIWFSLLSSIGMLEMFVFSLFEFWVRPGPLSFCSKTQWMGTQNLFKFQVHTRLKLAKHHVLCFQSSPSQFSPYLFMQTYLAYRAHITHTQLLLLLLLVSSIGFVCFSFFYQWHFRLKTNVKKNQRAQKKWLKWELCTFQRRAESENGAKSKGERKGTKTKTHIESKN